MRRLILTLILWPLAVCHGSPSSSESRHTCLFLDPELEPPAVQAADKRLADLDSGEPRTVRMFYFLPNDRPFRADVVQRIKDEMLRIQAWYGEQMEAHGYGYSTFRIETDDQGDPVVYRVDGQRPDSHYLEDTWDSAKEVGRSFDVSRNIAVIVVDNSTNRIRWTASGAATWTSKQSGIAMVGGDFAWDTLAHELAHTFGMGHDFRSDSYILSYGESRNSLSACSAGVLAVHPYFNPDVGVEWSELPVVELLTETTYPEGSESVPIRLRVRDAQGLQQVRLRVDTRPTHNPKYKGGTELKTCHAMMGEVEAIVEFDYDGVIPSGSAWGFSDLSDPPVHPIFITFVDRDGNRPTQGLALWERARQHLATLEVGEEVHGVVFLAGGRTLASGSGEGVELWDVETRTGTTTSLFGGVTVALSADGATLASGSGSGQIQLLDLDDDRVIATLSGHTQKIRSLAFSPDGRVLASGAQDGLRLWDVAAQTTTATLPVGVTSVAFSPDGSTLVSGSGDGVRLWNVATEAEVASDQHSDGWGPWVNSVAFSPDGTLVASGRNDATVRLWKVATGENLAVLEGHDYPVRSVAFSPDGTMLASAGPDLAANLWDPVSGERLAELRGRGRGANSLAFSSDGATLAAGTEDGRIDLWSLADWVRPRPRELVLISGDDQQGTSGEPLADPLVVEVRDQYGNPLPGVPVSFEVVEGDGKVGGQFTVEKTTSDARGRVEALLTLGPFERTNTVDVTVEGIEIVTFSAAGVGERPGPGPESDFRTWHLPDAAAIRLGKGRIRDVAFSPNEELLAVGTDVGIWLYDVATSREVALLPTRRIFDIAFSSDGRVLASCGSYKDRIRLWEVATGEELSSIDYRATALAFSPDGKTLASGSSFGIQFWDLETGTQKAAMSTAEGTWGIHSVAYSPDGGTLAAGSWWDHSVQLWDVETATKIATLEGHMDEVNSVSFAPDGRTVASASDDHTVKLWDVATRSILRTFEGHESWVHSVDFAPDGTLLASASKSVKLWDVDTGDATTFSRGFGLVAFSPDGRTLASQARSGGVALWEVATGNADAFASGHIRGPLSVALSPDGTTLASTSTYEIRLWDVASGTRTANLEGHTSLLGSVEFSPDGATLASAAADRIKLWDVATGAEIVTFSPSDSWILVAAFSPDGRWIASGHADATARVWDVATGEATLTLEGGHTLEVATVAFSRDGTTLATGGYGKFSLWDLATGALILTEEKQPGRVYSVFFDAAGTARASEFPAVSSPDAAILLHDTFSGSPSWPNVNAVAVRDLATGRSIANLKGHGEKILSLAFSGDGSTFASGSADGTILVWDLDRVLPHPRTLAGLSGHEQEGLPNAALQPFVIEVRDQHGDPLEGVEVTFRVTAGGGSLSEGTATTGASGRASSTLTLGLVPGPNTVEVVVDDLESVIFTARTRSIPTTLSKVDGDDQQGPSGSPLARPLVVSLLDQAGAPLAGRSVTFSITAGEGALSVTRATTDARGRAATTLTLGRTPGGNTVEVTVAGLAPVTFTAFGVAVPRTLARLSGDGQAGEPGAQLGEPLVVSVRDQNGSAFSGAVVTFAIHGEGGSLTALSDTTDAEGLATTSLILGEDYGTYSVVATVADLEPVTFTATAKANPDFDGDGEVGFADFFLFAEAFGRRDPRFDLDGSGSVDFADFFLFAEHFGQPARAKLVAMARELIGLPDGPRLRQNAPNPFNSGTVISWFQLQPGAARLEVFALTGQRVAVLHEGPQKAGLHRLTWDGRDDQGREVGSGVYLYRLVTAEAAQTRKLTLLR